MAYDETAKTLRLKRGWLTAPWLHLKQHAKAVDEEKPWMYCTDCHDYMLPKVKQHGGADEVEQKSLQRIPMRSRQEALYTRWHLDVGFPPPS